jgi:hypothetical protein
MERPIIRLAQCDRPVYGVSVRAFEVTVLSPACYAERPHSLALAAELRQEEGLFVYLILNAYWEVAGVRAAGGRQRRGGLLAPMDRHLPGGRPLRTSTRPWITVSLR